MESHTDLGRQLCRAYFHGVSDEHLEGSIEQLLSSVRTEHMIFADSTLRQALCICFQNPVVPPSARLSRTGRAIVRLELANGLLFALHLRGNIRPALDRLEQIGHWLALRPFAPDEFEHYDLVLSELVNAGQPPADCCEVRLARFASVSPLPGISREMLTSTAFSAFNFLHKQYGLRPLNRVPRLLSRHVVSHVDLSKHTVEAYLSRLDQDALDVIRRFDSTYRHRYNDLRVYNFFVAEHGKVCRNRIQAVEALPWLLRVLSGMQGLHANAGAPAKPLHLSDPRVISEIVQAIDLGKPLFGSVAQACNVPKETVRWTQRQMLQNVMQCAEPRMDLLLKILSWLPPEKRPRSDKDWRAMNGLVCALLPIFPACRADAVSPSALLAESRYIDVMARWMRELARPNLSSATRRLARLRDKGIVPADARNFIDALSRAIQGDCPTVPHHHTLLAWLASQSIYRILGLSRRWHQHLREQLQQIAPTALLEAEAPPAWPPVLATPIRLESLEVVELVTPDSLAMEGRAMEHCVGGYQLQCSAGDTVIVSIRQADGQRLSTAEMSIGDESLHVSVRQHRGRANRPAQTQCEQILTQLVALLNGAAYQERLRARRDFQSAGASTLQTASSREAPAAGRFRQMEEDAAWRCTFGSQAAWPETVVDAVQRTRSSRSGLNASADRTQSNRRASAMLP